MTFASLIVPLVGLLLGIVVGAVGAWLVSRSRVQADSSDAAAALAEARAAAERARAETSDARSETAQVRVELATQRELLAQHRTEAANADADRAEQQAMVSHARSEVAEARSALAAAAAERDAALAQVKAMTDDQQRMVDQFKVLSGEQLDKQGKAVDEATIERNKAVEAMLVPLTRQLGEFQSKLAEIEKERVSISSELREQVRQVTLTGTEVRRETAALVTALRKPQVRGQWGELQLKRAVELSGMVEHCHFEQQGTTTNAADATIRPDMTVMLGDDRYVHVDSKVPLNSFLDAQEAADPAEQERLLVAFTRNVRSHVDQLSGKRYWTSSEKATPEFVVMFIPSEALASEALTRMPDLLQYASDRNIIIATPTTLIGLLKTVAYSWRQADLAENAQQVFELARELYTRLGKMGTHVDKLGRALNSAVVAYNGTVGSLETRVLSTARKIASLNVTDEQLSTPRAIDEAVRPITSPELIESAHEVPSLLDDLSLTRPEPSTDALVADEQSRATAQATNRLRSLG
ncbi:DNA recombination protein RmuC [Propionibacteriaceae bacterium G1746]